MNKKWHTCGYMDRAWKWKRLVMTTTRLVSNIYSRYCGLKCLVIDKYVLNVEQTLKLLAEFGKKKVFLKVNVVLFTHFLYSLSGKMHDFLLCKK